MKVDFHCHTTASDGALTPEQLIDLAVQHEVKCLAITDHDTTAGYESVVEYAQQHNVQLISGVEISCEWRGSTIHIVGLDVDVNHLGLQQGLEGIRTSRWERAHQIMAKLEARHDFNVENIRSKIEQVVGEGVVGRGHFAQLLIEEHLVKDASQAFDRYLKKGRVGYVKHHWPPLAEVVQWINQAGGVAVIAHPKVYNMTSRKLNALITDFKQAGGQAIEVVNQPRHSADITGMADRANVQGLAASLGSDFHRPEHHWRGLGWLAPLPSKVTPVWTLFKTKVVFEPLETS
ncbi:FIG00031715: Predicted metal-dependent phosphoesterases (PHP family) [hydrothermal vent metagenome]|uniref:FIG00031715: Predicted metal-dependent phosphoesterases (PHP family) n=1 Tax=hydrothermal vent metagenome TaxID=652676 RepID=A0A3B0W2P3_9ZZZZ